MQYTARVLEIQCHLHSWCFGVIFKSHQSLFQEEAMALTPSMHGYSGAFWNSSSADEAALL